ncbi:MAG: DNA-binding protein [Pseudomonadaceae bacterium]|nr:MAG: DNA-binding protein [Pseudomonadaceae bacterium]
MRKVVIAIAALILVLVVWLFMSGTASHLWHGWRLSKVELPAQALDLSRYRADIQRQRVRGIEDDLSALTWNSETGTLWSVLNGRPYIVELSPEGELLREIRVEGVRDLEGISHIQGERYVLAEERTQRLLLIDLAEVDDVLNISQAPSLSIALDQSKNKGFEGASWDEEGRRLLVVKERDPMRVLAISGFVDQLDGEPLQLAIEELKDSNSPRLFMRDLSSITMLSSGHLLLLSDESKMLVEYSPDGKPLSMLGLRMGSAGLRRSVPQAEGVAVDDQGRIFIVSEPNLFYRFVPQAD